ncbi:MAG: thioredoxin domain-containing protein [Bacteroidota bacterium]
MPHDPLPEITDADHARGPENARITLVQYGDFECPFGRQVFEIVRDVQARFTDDVRLVFRHFPLRYHPHALIAAIAAEAVAEASGAEAFWAFRERLYENQNALRRDLLPQHAEAIGSDREAVHRAIEEETRKSEILAQKRGGVRAGVRSSLNLFIDGELFEDNALEDALVERVIQPLKGKEV